MSDQDGIPTRSGVFAPGDMRFASGTVLRNARVAWKCWGTLAPGRDNVLLYPTSFAATHEEQAWLIGRGRILDPTRWFVVTCDMFGNGLSSSPSNDPDYPPLVSIADNVEAQHACLRAAFGIERIACVYGFSMGAIQAYHWAAMFPDRVERAAIVCGSARTSVHNRVFLKGLLATLEAAPEHVGGGRFSSEPGAALRAFSRIYAGWVASQDWYRAGLYLAAAADLDDFLDRVWAPAWAGCRAADLYAQLRSWEEADISNGGDLSATLARIEARVLLLPSRTDLYFTVADNEAELPFLRYGTLRVIPSIWGHRAGSPSRNSEDEAFLREAVAQLMAC